MVNVKNVFTCGLFVLLSGFANASDTASLVSDNTHKISVVTEVTQVTAPDGNSHTVKTEQLVAGSKIFKRADGTCFKETTSIDKSISVNSSVPGETVDLPATTFESHDVDCGLKSK
jgi:hypothetical protein